MTQAVDEKDLWTRYKSRGDAAARETLIVKYMSVVRFVAGRMAMHVPPTIDVEDLAGWGVLGLLDAVEKFDPAQEIKFSTYATIRVRGAILDEIRSLDWAPRSLRAMARKIGGARDKLRHERTGEPSSDDIAAELGATTEEVDDCLAQVQTAQVLALDDYLPGEDRDEARRLSLIEDTGAKSPETEAQARERGAKLVSAIQELPDQQQKVLNLYYYEELTLKEIGTVLDVSESRVCQIHGAALKRLRQAVHGSM